MSLRRFDEIAEFFDELTEAPLHRRMRRAVLFALGELEGRDVLDLGTGPGGLALDMSGRGGRVIGVDGAPEMLRRAALRRRDQERRLGRSLSLGLVRADASRLPLAAGSIDRIAGMLILHLLPDPVPALRECARVSRPGTRIAFLTQSDDFGPDAAQLPREPLDPVEQAFLQGCCASAESHPRYDRDAWVGAFTAAGLPRPTITVAQPHVAWLLFACLPGEPVHGAGYS